MTCLIININVFRKKIYFILNSLVVVVFVVCGVVVVVVGPGFGVVGVGQGSLGLV